MKIKKIIYVSLTTFLGLLLGMLAHAGIEIAYIHYALSRDIVLSNHLFLGHYYCVLPTWLQLIVLAGGILLGLYLGFTWWRIVYVEKRLFRWHRR